MKRTSAYPINLKNAWRWPFRQLRTYWQRGRWQKIIAITVSLGLVLLGGMYGIARWYIWSQRDTPLTMGVSFVPDYATYLGVDPQQTMDALINDVGIRQFRLTSYWSDIEPTPGKYDFTQLDWEFQKAESAHATVTLSLGLRQPRYPECHMPDWAVSEPATLWQPQLKAEMTAVMQRYKNSPSLQSYQLENEYFLKGFGSCTNFDRNRLIDEYNLVKSTDPAHPIIISRSNNAIGFPVGDPTPDEFGISIYRRVWDNTLHTHRYLQYPFPAWYYAFLAGVQKITTGDDTIIHELQAEAWAPGDKNILDISLAEQNKSFNATRLKDTVQFGKATGMKTMDLWGAEYWYYRKEKLQDPTVWDTAKQLFGGPKASRTTANSASLLFTVTNSGSTNSTGFSLTVNDDGSGKLTSDTPPRFQKVNAQAAQATYPAGTFQLSSLSNLLNSYGDISKLGSNQCLKSASFGVTEKISYHGITSSDLTCENDDVASQKLTAAIHSVIQPAGVE